MATNCILDGDENQIDQEGVMTLVANFIKSTAADFSLAHPGRRSSPGARRALVHDNNDGLTINFNSDYPGGVTIHSVTRLSPKPVHFDPRILRRVPELPIDGGIRFVWDYGVRVGGPMQEEMSLQSVIEGLQGEIAELKERVAALGG